MSSIAMLASELKALDDDWHEKRKVFEEAENKEATLWLAARDQVLLKYKQKIYTTIPDIGVRPSFCSIGRAPFCFGLTLDNGQAPKLQLCFNTFVLEQLPALSDVLLSYASAFKQDKSDHNTDPEYIVPDEILPRELRYFALKSHSGRYEFPTEVRHTGKKAGKYDEGPNNIFDIRYFNNTLLLTFDKTDVTPLQAAEIAVLLKDISYNRSNKY